jgi:hypothetical protein
MSEPIDLTTLGAATPLPPSDHPIFQGPVKSASEIVDFDYTGMDPHLARFLQSLVYRIGELERAQNERREYVSRASGGGRGSGGSSRHARKRGSPR